MSKMNLQVFQAMATTKLLMSGQKKTIQVKAERNLLGRLLMLSQTHDTSLDKVSEYQLGKIPWTLATADGGMTKTD